ncbi:hypothetical protein C4D60_Mb02t13220 [Musa balbisiana]|uniref:FG-GAP repeat-containing protein n=1 Tax=Musa balbisiana TaxID=52838 RepID=A0A4S8IAD8_MUSBA|nr:hypothetical protein C4D60_Mb02t13220 [Musa balbisiana]
MRKRDLGILLLAAFAIFFSLQHEGDFSFKEAWYHLSDEYPIKFEAERLPPPVVVDLNGDGKSEILVATHDAKIQVLEPHRRRVDEGFAEARVLAEVSLLPDKIRISSGRRPVALAAGVVDRSYKHGEMRKQVVVVVTSGWLVMCFDHNLKKLWENNLQDDFPHGAHHREIAISISNYTLKHGDAGLIIVGGRMEMHHQNSMDLFEETMTADEGGELHRRNTNEKENSGSGNVDLRHFAFYAFAGRTGTLRWSRKNDNIQVQSSDASQLIPQHNYKLDVHALNARHPGERSLYIPTITNHTQVWWVPNVVVAHQKEGIEAVHLASGRTICQLHLPEGGLHADINGDGVLDHVQVVGANGAEQTVVSGSMEVLKPCWAVATSGVPVREQLFNVSICHHSPFNLFQHGDFARSFGRNYDVGSLEVATPILVSRDDGHKHRKGSHGDVVFLTNHGEVTSYSPGLHGHDAVWRWQISTGATWSNVPSPFRMMEDVIVPTLKSFPLHAHSDKEVIVAAGEHEAVVISHGGNMLASIELPGLPTHALVLEDFSNDGLTDIILVTSGGVYGYVQTRQPGALFFSTLVGCLIVVIVVIFVSQHLNSISKGKPRASSDHRIVANMKISCEILCGPML